MSGGLQNRRSVAPNHLALPLSRRQGGPGVRIGLKPRRSRLETGYLHHPFYGELAEWLKASTLKVEVRPNAPRVRILHSPPFSTVLSSHASRTLDSGSSLAGFRNSQGRPFHWRLAQLVRAARLHRAGRGFESLSANQPTTSFPSSSVGRARDC